MENLVKFIFHPLVSALLITIYLYRRYQIEDKSDLVIIYLSVSVFLWFFNKSSTLTDWRTPSAPFNSDGGSFGAD